MNVKLIAMGNILMKDDGIAIEAAKMLEEALTSRGIEVIYGETDVSYCLTQIQQDDYIILLDAGVYHNQPGMITVIPFSSESIYAGSSQHNYNLFHIIKIYFPHVKGEVIAIDINEIGFGIGLSRMLIEKLEDITKRILSQIEHDLLQLV